MVYGVLVLSVRDGGLTSIREYIDTQALARVSGVQGRISTRLGLPPFLRRRRPPRWRCPTDRTRSPKWRIAAADLLVLGLLPLGFTDMAAALLRRCDGSSSRCCGPCRCRTNCAIGVIGPHGPASTHFLLQSSYLAFQAFYSIERIVEAGGLQRSQEGAGGREGAANFPLPWDRMAGGVSHRKLLTSEAIPREPRPQRRPSG